MADVTCTSCQRPTDELAVFPGTICLDCYQQTPEANRPITADELTAMWGGRPAHRRSGEMRVGCSGCDRSIPARYTICAACAEDMGYARRAR